MPGPFFLCSMLESRELWTLKKRGKREEGEESEKTLNACAAPRCGGGRPAGHVSCPNGPKVVCLAAFQPIP